MIVQCESCQTRFHVADARIPEKGARVRCSRCHHRFHITPSSAAPNAQPSGAEQGSASETLRGEPARPAAARAEGRKEDELDNPEFLFDEKSEDSHPSRADIDAAAQALRDPVGPPPPEHTHGLEHVPAEERVVASGGKTAQEMLDAGAPVLSQTRFEIGGELIEDEAGDDQTGTGTREFTQPMPPRKAAAAPSGPPARAEVDALGGLDDEDESSFAGWDPLATQGNDHPDGPPEKFFDLASAIAGTPAEAAASAKPTSVFDQPDIATPAPAKKRSAPDVPVFDPEAPGAAAFALRAAAWAVGLGLVLVAARGLWLRAETDFAPPALVHADGWVAADLETFLARDALGERVLVVRGNLIPDGATSAPQITVRVLGRNGDVLAEAPRTWLERIDDAEVAPDALSLRLASAGGEVAAIGQLVTGFTAVLADPPPGSRRVEIALRAAAMPPRGTATAAEPVPQPPSSQVAPVDPSVVATPTAPPAPPRGADVIPAAPDVVD